MQKSNCAEYELYKRIRLLGEGSFGKAYLVECLQDHSLWVIKQMSLNAMTEDERKQTVKEAKILEVLSHQNIVKFREVYKTKKGKLCIVMEYADGGDLGKVIKDAKGKYFEENQILDWFTQICLALKHVHDRKIIHRDLKCQNIFLTKNKLIKLGDFGIARVLNKTMEKAKTMVGTPYYLSPEIIETRPYSFKSDIWSLGVILYELCALKPPFNADSLHFLALRIVRGSFQAIPVQYSREMKNLINSMLQINPDKRPTIHEILKMPIITNRIRNFLSESVRKFEFAHTIMHNQKFVNPKPEIGNMKTVANELPCPPQLLPQFPSTQQQQEQNIQLPQINKQQPQLQAQQNPRGDLKTPQFKKEDNQRIIDQLPKKNYNEQQLQKVPQANNLQANKKDEKVIIMPQIQQKGKIENKQLPPKPLKGGMLENNKEKQNAYDKKPNTPAANQNRKPIEPIIQNRLMTPMENNHKQIFNNNNAKDAQYNLKNQNIDNQLEKKFLRQPSAPVISPNKQIQQKNEAKINKSKPKSKNSSRDSKNEREKQQNQQPMKKQIDNIQKKKNNDIDKVQQNEQLQKKKDWQEEREQMHQDIQKKRDEKKKNLMQPLDDDDIGSLQVSTNLSSIQNNSEVIISKFSVEKSEGNNSNQYGIFDKEVKVKHNQQKNDMNSQQQQQINNSLVNIVEENKQNQENIIKERKKWFPSAKEGDQNNQLQQQQQQQLQQKANKKQEQQQQFNNKPNKEQNDKISTQQSLDQQNEEQKQNIQISDEQQQQMKDQQKYPDNKNQNVDENVLDSINLLKDNNFALMLEELQKQVIEATEQVDKIQNIDKIDSDKFLPMLLSCKLTDQELLYMQQKKDIKSKSANDEPNNQGIQLISNQQAQDEDDRDDDTNEVDEQGNYEIDLDNQKKQVQQKLFNMEMSKEEQDSVKYLNENLEQSNLMDQYTSLEQKMGKDNFQKAKKILQYEVQDDPELLKLENANSLQQLFPFLDKNTIKQNIPLLIALVIIDEKKKKIM